MRERILVVDDNKALAKLIAKKMEQNIDMEIVVAHSLSQAKDILEDNDDFFIALLDLNLPDAPNGEIVDYVLSLGILVIVLTGSMDEETKNTFMSKNIVDYVVKSNMSNINYIFDTINRISKNRNHKILVVDSKANSRNMIKKALSDLQFRVFAAAHGEEALSYLNDNPDIDMIIAENKMPVIDGFELTQRVRETYDKDRLSIVAMLEQNEKDDVAKFVKNGANEIISRPFGKEELVCRINNAAELLENANLELKLRTTDYSTKLPNRNFFFSFLKDLSKTQANRAVTISTINIDNFDQISCKFGYKAADFVVEKLSHIIMSYVGESGIVARFGKDEFCMALYNIDYDSAVKQMVAIRTAVASLREEFNGNKLLFSVSIGINNGDLSKNIEEMVAGANQALRKAKDNGKNRVEVL